ncbi:MAG TPA: alpha/beta hydrolase-fold protein [Chitinophaga sp.]|uniref:alpha/beta hydrolase n=1 Tax=Chitinophaga sp. TaxID=1869181 RepID=UPI002C652D83|nr:alpha/beta hydrolase-fold protein [Chitinophaga sp.]HVI48664.1 alpha/beta hydrolase-fold protein [Chitinophaga sp.]
MKRIPALLLLFILTLSAKAQQQPAPGEPFVLGITEKIPSAQLAETRTLNIYLPDGYKADTAAYPVIYLLDGSANEDFIHMTGLVQFLTMIKKMPPAIVVGIANVDRRRDFTHIVDVNSPQVQKDMQQSPTAGGSAKFMAFIEKELQPYIQQHYRVTGKTTIVGQSLGGLLASEILLKKPALFNNYLIVSPSLWWSDESMLKRAPALLKENLHNDVRVYIAVGSEGKVMIGDAEQLAKDLGTAGRHVKVQYAPMPEENHLTILHNSAYKGFEALFR